MTRLAPVGPTLDVDTLDVWHNLNDARRTYARIGIDPDWRQHRADAHAEMHPNLGRAKAQEPTTSRADIAEEVVFFAGLGMPTADVCDRLNEKPGTIARALRSVGEDRLADTFAEYAKYVSGTAEARAARGETKPKPKKFVSKSGMPHCCSLRLHELDVAKSRVRRDARSLVRHPDSQALKDRLKISQEQVADSERITARHLAECDGSAA